MQFFAMATSIIIARIAGPTILGTASFGLSYAMTFGFIMDMGSGTAHIKLVSSGKDLGNCISTFKRIKLGLLLFYVIFMLGFFNAQKYIFNHHFESKVHEQVIFVFIFVTVLTYLYQIPQYTFTALTQQARTDIPTIITLVVTKLLRIIAIVIGFGALGLAFSNLTAMILMAPIYWYLFKDYPKGKFDKELAKEYFRISFPVIFILISVNMMGTLDKVLLQFFASSKEVGIYSVGFQLGNFVKIIGISVGTIFFPYFSRYIKEKKYNNINRNINKFERFTYVFILPLALLVILYSNLIISVLLGPKYAGAEKVVPILIVSMFIFVINQPLGTLIFANNKFAVSAILNIIALVVMVGSQVVLCHPKLGNLKAIGTAISVGISRIFLGLAYRFYIHKNFLEIKVLKNIKYFILMIMILFITFVINKFLQASNNIYLILIIPLVFVSIIALFEYKFKLVNNEDVALLKEAINFKKVFEYIRYEFKIGKKK